MANPETQSERHSLVAKATGALVAFAVGDALGWPQEMPRRSKPFEPSVNLKPWTRRSGTHFQPYTEQIRAGEYSDDTQLTFALGRALLCSSDWQGCFTRRELPLFHLYQRGAGRSLLKACAAWRKGNAPWMVSNEADVRAYFETGANGAAMRVLPHSIWHASGGARSIRDLAVDVFIDSVSTHGHPRAHVGATLYAAAAYLLFRTQDTLPYGALIRLLLENADGWADVPEPPSGAWRELHDRQHGPFLQHWKRTVDETVHLLHIAAQALGRGALADDVETLQQLGCLGKQKGSGIATSVGAIYLASRHAANPRAGVMSASFTAGADTDTLGAMTAGLLGAISGISWMPTEWLGVQDGDALKDLAARLASRRKVETGWKILEDRDLARIYEGLGHGDTEIDASLRAEVVGHETDDLGGRTTNIWRLRFNDGQTLYLRKNAAEPAPPARKRAKARATVKQVRIPVERMAQMLTFYERGIGLEVVTEDERIVSFGVLALSLRVEDAPDRRPGGIIEVHATDYDAVIARIETYGGLLLSSSSDDAEQRWVRVRDPEGNVVEIVELQDRSLKRA